MLDARLLVELGLAPKEAEIVVHMASSLKASGRGYFQAPSLAGEVGVPREKIYTYLKSLEKKGVIESIGLRPKTFALRPVNEFLDRLAAARRRDVETSITELEAMVEEAKKAEYGSLMPRISILRDRAQYLRTMIDIIQSSESVMIIARTSALLLPWALETGPAQLLEAYRNLLLEKSKSDMLKVEYFIPFEYTRQEIVKRSKTHSSEARRACQTLREFCAPSRSSNISVRNIPGLPAISLIIGNGKVAAGFTSEEEARTAKGVLVESRDFFQFMSSIYDLLASQPDAGITAEMVQEVQDEVDKEASRALKQAMDRVGRGRRQLP